MHRIFNALIRRLTQFGWRDIASAPSDRVIELAVIDDDRHPLGFPCIRRADGWLDATTMQPVIVSATHWRYWRPDVLPMCCC
ncbi:hypothetical protein FDV58_27445 [Bradyrhizobium elkanii]|uniref:Uncharacterized protein n=1 Tax=Bradyrhizobium elkanii TaxID=29448 RepID=A0A4U6RVT6_BRAEL|nr:hypothetical protein [Bradyrhizobium elkanii]TKV78273.1 hypothetical protein FDV58_27445 [Bradyrhizobium elkanii]